MNFLALVSGGKDSILSIKKCQDFGYNLICIGNLNPVEKDELDSHMFQTIGHEMVPKIAEAIGVPLVRQDLVGKSLNTDKMEYHQSSNDTKQDNQDI